MEHEQRRANLSIFGTDVAVRESVVSRRNFYLGLWAGRQFGLSDRALRDYARSVAEADDAAGRAKTLIQKLERDFIARGCPVAREEILYQIHRTEAVAQRQFMAGGSTD